MQQTTSPIIILMMATRLVLFLIIITPVMSVDRFEPVNLAPLTITGNFKQGAHACPSNDRREELKQNISATVQEIITTWFVPHSPDLDHPCGPGSWRRVAFLNMTDTAQLCPTHWALYDASIDSRSCVRPSVSGCVSNYFTTGDLEYSGTSHNGPSQAERPLTI